MFSKKSSRVQMSKEEIRAKMQETPLEKGDMLALIIAGLVTIMPMILAICAVFIFVIWLIFLR